VKYRCRKVETGSRLNECQIGGHGESYRETIAKVCGQLKPITTAAATTTGAFRPFVTKLETESITGAGDDKGIIPPITTDIVTRDMKKSILNQKRLWAKDFMEVSPEGHISHSFFVDDVLIVGILNRFSWLHLFHIFTKFGNASGLILNQCKSSIVHDQCDMEIIDYIRRLFGVASEILIGGMKYLDFHIKACSYRVHD